VIAIPATIFLVVGYEPLSRPIALELLIVAVSGSAPGYLEKVI
jgi:hypothetical protein